MNTSKSLDELIDTALHPERNGLLIKEQVAEGANHEWLVKRELKAAIVEAVVGIYGDSDGLREFAGLNLIKSVPEVPSKRKELL